MAVFPAFPGLQVAVVVDGAARVEHPDPSDADQDTGSKVTRYIESESGKTFEIHFRIDRHFKHFKSNLNARVEMDGGVATKRNFFPEDAPKGRGHVKIIQGILEPRKDGKEWFIRRFKFSNLDTDDGAASSVSAALRDRIKNVGQISVSFYRIAKLGKVKVTSEPTRRDRWSGINTLPEKTLKGKAVSSKISLGHKERTTVSKNRWTTQYIDSRDSPFAVVVFHYRSLNDLKAEYIVPRSPTPIALEDRPIDELNPEELRELVRRQREQAKSVKAETKREPVEGYVDDEDLSFVVQRPAKRMRYGETIDLTDD